MKIQEKETSDIFFVANVRGRNKNLKSRPLRVHDDVKLYPLRYGVYNGLVTESIDGSKKRSVKHYPANFSLDQCQCLVPESNVAFQNNNPFICRYDYYRMPVREGWIYLYKERKAGYRNSFFEYRVNSRGTMSNIFWKEEDAPAMEDGYIAMPASPYYRKDSVGTTRDYIPLSLMKDKKVWICYSEVRWSKDFAKKVYADEELRNQVMQVLDCEGWFGGKAQPHAIKATDDIQVLFPPKPDYFYTSSLIDPPYKHHWDEEKADYENYCTLTSQKYDGYRERETDNESYNLYYCLNDMLGVADTIGHDLTLEHNRQRALVYSLQTGRKPEEFLDKLCRNKEIDIESTADEVQAAALHVLSLECYQLFFNDKMPEEIRNTADEIDVDRLFKILGVKERKNGRIRIEAFRESFSELLDHSIYQQSYFPYVENTPCAVAEGKCRLMTHFHLLKMRAHTADFYMDRGATLLEEDRFKKTHVNLLTAQTYAAKLMDKELELEDVVEESKILGIDKPVSDGVSLPLLNILFAIDAISEIYVEYLSDPKDVMVELPYLKRIRVKGEDLVVLMKKHNMNQWLRENRYRPAYDVVSYGPRSGGFKPRIRYKEGMLGTRPNEIRLPLIKESTPYQRSIKSFFAHTVYQKVLFSLALWNLLTIDLSKPEDTVTSDAINAVVTIILVLTKRIRPAATVLSVAGRSISMKLTRDLLSAAGNMVSVGESYALATERLRYKDYDAMIAYSLSTIGWAVVAVATLAPVGWVSALGGRLLLYVSGTLLGISGNIVGGLLTNTALEDFLQLTLLQKTSFRKIIGDIDKNSPSGLINVLVKETNRKSLLEQDYINQQKVLDEYYFRFTGFIRVDVFPIYYIRKEENIFRIDTIIVNCSFPMSMPGFQEWKDIECELTFREEIYEDRRPSIHRKDNTRIVNPEIDFVKNSFFKTVKLAYTDIYFLKNGSCSIFFSTSELQDNYIHLCNTAGYLTLAIYDKTEAASNCSKDYYFQYEYYIEPIDETLPLRVFSGKETMIKKYYMGEKDFLLSDDDVAMEVQGRKYRGDKSIQKIRKKNDNNEEINT